MDQYPIKWGGGGGSYLPCSVLQFNEPSASPPVLPSCSCNMLDVLYFFLISSHSSSTQVSFRGVIVSRELRQSDTPSQRLPNGLVEVPKFGPVKTAAIKDLRLGYTLLWNTIVQLRVRDPQSPNTISVYLDLRRTNYICGLLPGK